MTTFFVTNAMVLEYKSEEECDICLSDYNISGFRNEVQEPLVLFEGLSIGFSNVTLHQIL